MFTRKVVLIQKFRLTVGVMILLSICTYAFAKQQDSNKEENLFEMSLEQLMTVEVTTASKRPEEIHDAPGVMTVVTKDEIRMFGARNLLDILNRLPNVYTRGSYLFPDNIASIRGDLPTHINNHTLVLINGRPFRESNTGGLNYTIYTGFPIEMIERIELIRGPGSVLYGSNAYTGIINVITKVGKEKTLDIASEGGSFGYYRNTIAGGNRKGDLSFYGAIRQSSEDGWRYSAVDESDVYDSIRRKRKNESVSAYLEKGPFTLDLFYTRQEAFHIGRKPTWSLRDNILETERLFVDLGHRLELNKEWKIVTHVGLNTNDYTFEGGTQERESIDVLGEVTLFGSPTKKLNIVSGYVIEHQAQPKLGRSSIKKYSRFPLSAYGQADYKLYKDLKVFGGLQWNEPEDGDGDFITRTGVIWDLGPNWGVKFLRGEAFRAPWALETSVSNPVLVGNSDLSPEKITTYDAQVFYHNKQTQLAATLFQSTMKDLIIRDTSVSPPTYKNGEEVDYCGIEFEGKHYLNPKLYALGSVTYQDSKEDSGINPSSVPNTMGKLGLGYKNKRMSAGIFYTYFSRTESITGASKVNSDPDSIHWITANLNYDVSNWFEMKKGSATLTFSVENLLDQEIYHPEFNRRNINSLPGAQGLAFFGGLRLRF